MAYCTEGVFSVLQVDPDLVYNMALSGVHQNPICVVINEDPFASDMSAYNAWLHAVNGILVRAFVRSEGVCVWGAVTTSVLVIATAPMFTATVMSAASTSAAPFTAAAVSATAASSPSAHSSNLMARRVL